MSITIAKYISISANKCGYIGTAEALIVNCVHPFFSKAKATARKEDNTNCIEATTGPFVDKYRKAMKTNIVTLEYMCAWEIVEGDDNMNVILLTRALKCKRYLDGLIKKFKT